MKSGALPSVSIAPGDAHPVAVLELALLQAALVDLADRAQQALGDLGLGHLEREQRDRLLQRHRDVLGDVEREARLAHRGPRGQDHEVRLLQARGLAIELAEAGRKARDAAAVAVLEQQREPVEGLVERLLDEREVLGRAVLRDLVDLLLGHVEQLARVARAVVAELGDLGADADQPAQHGHLAHDVGVAPGVRDDGDGLGQREHGRAAADLRERAALVEAVADRDLVDGLRLLVEVEHRREDLAVPAAIEVVGLEHLGGLGDRRLREQHRAEHRLLGVEVLGRQAPRGHPPSRARSLSDPSTAGTLAVRSRRRTARARDAIPLFAARTAHSH